MKSTLLKMLFVGLFIAGCDSMSTQTPEINEERQLTNRVLVSPDGIPVNDYLVHFDGRTYDADHDQTTFAYTVSGTGIEPELTRFGIELPACAPELASFSPEEGVNIDDSARIEWSINVGTAESKSYSITFPGHVGTGLVRVGIKRGDIDGVGLAPGPCGEDNSFDIGGSVYTDADLNASFPDDETGVEHVTVHLMSPLGFIASTVTDSYGNYLFADQLAGTYSVSIPASTPADDFNETLVDKFVYTAGSPIELEVTIGPSSENNDFGFEPIIDELLEDFETGDITTTGESVFFWQEQLKSALGEKGRKGQSGIIDAVTMQEYLDAIEVLALPDPYQFDDLNEFQAALDILRNGSQDDIDLLRRELLATELNLVSGRGAEVEGLTEVLVGWGEALVVDNTVAPSATKSSLSRVQINATLGEATALFKAINGGDKSGNE